MNGLHHPTNPHLSKMDNDYLYHLGLGTASHDLKEMFGNVRFVCMGGTPERMKNFAHYVLKELGNKLPTGTTLYNISEHSHRYAMYKVGPVLSVSHGMGVPSLSILLNEMIKLMSHAGVSDPIFFRLGTSGGIGLPGGQVVVTSEALNPQLRPVYENIVLGHVVQHPTALDEDLSRELLALGKKMDFKVVIGKTMCTDDFYEGQGRLDGAFCNYTEADKMSYLQRCDDAGVKNIEMEATCFAGMTHRAGVKSAIVCVTLLDRLHGDQISSAPDAKTWQKRPQQLVAAYIKQQLGLWESSDYGDAFDAQTVGPLLYESGKPLRNWQLPSMQRADRQISKESQSGFEDQVGSYKATIPPPSPI